MKAMDGEVDIAADVLKTKHFIKLSGRVWYPCGTRRGQS